MIVTKPEVRLKGLSAGLVWILYALEEFHRMYDGVQPTTLVITSINDGTHSVGSKHYINEAIDLRSKNFPTRESKRVFRAKFEDFLNKHPVLTLYQPARVGKMRVLLEAENTANEHFHIQVRKGMEFP